MINEKSTKLELLKIDNAVQHNRNRISRNYGMFSDNIQDLF